jgi:hypothetical protein
VRAPALRFAVAGALLYALLDWTPAAPPRPAAADDDALLLDLAVTAQLDRTDPLVRDRLVSLGRFLALAPGADDTVLEREARGVGLVRSDPIIRRHLVDLMQLTAAALPSNALPDDATLRAYYETRREAYALPERVGLTHVYLSRDRRGAAIDADAAQMVSALRRGDRVQGDPFARGAQIGPATGDELARVFGAAFVEQVGTLPVGEWSAPIASAYGVHVVRVEARIAGGPPPFDSVRGQVLHQWLRERREQQLAATLAGLRGD